MTTSGGVREVLDSMLGEMIKEYFYLVNEDDLSLPIPKRWDRPKGVKNGRGKQRKNQKAKIMRGGKGLFTVFDR
ncbi:MAG: hypothetical protein K9W44_00335 [Candidatus Lokiarchaeota archaeon]|nr:hypothetical protein [Candidatus Harpocratesius repetitus]